VRNAWIAASTTLTESGSIRTRAYGRRVDSIQPVLLVLGYAVGVLFYVGAGLALVRGARSLAAGIVAFYWRHRSRAEVAAIDRRVARVQQPPTRRAA